MVSSKYAFAVDARRVWLSSLSHPHAPIYNSAPPSNDDVDPSPAGVIPAHQFLTLRTHEATLSDARFEEIIISGQVGWLIDVMKGTNFHSHPRVHLLISSILSEPGRLLLIRRGNWLRRLPRFKVKLRILKGAFQLCLGSRGPPCITIPTTFVDSALMS